MLSSFSLPSILFSQLQPVFDPLHLVCTCLLGRQPFSFKLCPCSSFSLQAMSLHHPLCYLCFLSFGLHSRSFSFCSCSSFGAHSIIFGFLACRFLSIRSQGVSFSNPPRSSICMQSSLFRICSSFCSCSSHHVGFSFVHCCFSRSVFSLDLFKQPVSFSLSCSILTCIFFWTQDFSLSRLIVRHKFPVLSFPSSFCYSCR